MGKALSSLGNVFGDIGGGFGNVLGALPIVGPMIGATMDIFGAGPASQAEKQQEEMADYYAQKNLQTNAFLQNQQANLWKENAFPTQAVIDAARASGMAGLGSERSRAYQNLARNLSVRGIGPGSPYGGAGASSIEGSYMGGLSNLMNSLTQLQNTPRFAFPFSNTMGAGAAPNVTSNQYSNPLGMALGMMAGQKALSGMFGSNTSGSPLMGMNSGAPLEDYSMPSLASVPGINSGLGDLLAFLG